MSRNWTLLALILFLGSTGTLQAQPLDSPDVVYIDGQAVQPRVPGLYGLGLIGRCRPGATRNARPVAVPVEPEVDGSNR